MIVIRDTFLNIPYTTRVSTHIRLYQNKNLSNIDTLQVILRG